MSSAANTSSKQVNNVNSNVSPNDFIVVYYANDDGKFKCIFLRTHDSEKIRRCTYRYKGRYSNDVEALKRDQEDFCLDRCALVPSDPKIEITQQMNVSTGEKVSPSTPNSIDIFNIFEPANISSKRDIEEVPEQAIKQYNKCKNNGGIVVRYNKLYLYVMPGRMFGLDEANKLKVYSD